MTNRKWMEQLSDEDLSNFLTNGLPKDIEINSNPPTYYTILINIGSIARQYIQSATGIMQWLNETHTD